MAPPILAFGLAVASAAAFVTEATAQRACIAQGEPLSGTLREVRRQHPNGTPLRVLQLELGASACVEGAALEGGRLTFRRVHVVPADPAAEGRLRAAIGGRVAVRGRELIEAHTAWHVGDAVLLDATVAAR